MEVPLRDHMDALMAAERRRIDAILAEHQKAVRLLAEAQAAKLVSVVSIAIAAATLIYHMLASR